MQKRVKVVTVDDSLMVAKRLHIMISEIEGVDVLGNAINISAAKQLISTKKPDIVILDIQLADDEPQGNGMNLLNTLREQYPEMAIIMLTNLIESQYRNTCMAMGANYFFDKSIDFEKVPDAIRIIVNSIKN